MATPIRFGTDGVRGVAGEDLTHDVVAALGRAVARVLGVDRPFLVARDTRESGPLLERALGSGLTAEGAAVESVGVFPTPGLAYLSQARGLPGAMISASHNPYRDNGIKVFGPDGRKLPDEVERRIEAELSDPGSRVGGRASPRRGGAEVEGSVEAAPGATGEYLEHLADAVEGRTLGGLRVVVDCAHGAAVSTAPIALGELGAEVVAIACEPDGRNINEGCGSTHPEALQRAVVEHGADAGLAFDGDADRVIAVDERGRVVDGDQLMGVAAVDLRERGRLRHDTVVATVMSNLGLHRAMEAHGIAVRRTRVGDRHVLAAMDEGGYSLGGEQSGHVIFRDLATTGDGVLSGLVLLDVVVRTGRRLSELASVVRRLPQVLHNVRVADPDGLGAADAFWDDVRSVEEELGDRGRVLVRPSGTEPVVRVMVEAGSESEAERLAVGLGERLVAALGSPGP